MTTAKLNTKIKDLQRLRMNTETFLLGFLQFTTSKKTPYANSWIGFDFDRNTYIFMCLDKHSTYDYGDRMIFYPNNSNRILITSDTKWINNLCSIIKYKSDKIDSEYLKRIASNAQPFLMSLIDKEIEFQKSKLPKVETKKQIGKLF